MNVKEIVLLDQLLLHRLTDGRLRELEEAVQPQEVGEFGDEVACELVDDFADSFIFAFLKALHHNLLQLVCLERLADLDQVGENFHGLICERVLNVLVFIVWL